jgi:predicted RecB family nuclease
MVVNIASHDDWAAEGRLVEITLDAGKVSNIEFFHLPPTNLHAISGVGYRNAQLLESGGIKTLKDLLSSNIDDVCRRTGISFTNLSNWRARADAIMNNKAVLINKLEITDPVFCDIETNLDQSLVWLICIFDPKENKLNQFLALNPNEEEQMLKKFVSYLSDNNHKLFYCYSGTYFDQRVLLSRLAAYNIKPDVLPRFEDLLLLLRKSLLLPISNYRLKDVGDLFGFTKRHPKMDGFDAAISYNIFTQSKDAKLLKRLMEYNADDASSLWHILKKIDKMELNKPYSPKELL